MAGIDRDTPIPSEIKLHQKSRRLEVSYENGEQFMLDFEYLRVFTPSAEARGHAPGQETLQTGKRNVEIQRIEPVGTYALRFIFSDAHDSGLYSWDLLYNLGKHHDELWQDYLKQIETQGLSRDIDTSSRPAGGSCGQHH
ncbi:MAG: 1-(5-phosphoribosyl)-5-((5-phosphoribosylamino)methylideneamino)imidazole-4-carboxamide isomerase [Betaproteobacteria bacterium HGW-Betaproteobacteria-10]|nr:MAG: 1-(5-phosphoribosyl)-5-((5-phosphoribosylamino)methylideneamino)imidazole-4-carboxamide isomerase [Betaproteobacteria bacterium HGW-Betaproteobacteria-10]